MTRNTVARKSGKRIQGATRMNQKKEYNYYKINNHEENDGYKKKKAKK